MWQIPYTSLQGDKVCDSCRKQLYRVDVIPEKVVDCGEKSVT